MTCLNFCLKIYPKIFPILAGRVQFKKIEIVRPRFQIRLQLQRVSEPVEVDYQSMLRNLSEQLLDLLADPVLTDPGLDYLIRDGQMDILSSAPTKPIFRKINAYLRHSNDQLHLQISCEPNIGREINMTGWLRPDEQRAKGRLHIKQFRPHLLTEVLFPESSFRIIDSGMNLAVALLVNPDNHLQADIELTEVSLRMQNDLAAAETMGGTVQASIMVSPRSAVISLSKLLFDSPRMNVSGHLFIDQIQSETGIELSATDVHLDPLRRVAEVVGKGNRSVQDVFEVLTGGWIPFVSLSGRGRSLTDLSRIENLTVKGRMADGRIHIPGLNLHIEKVIGNATIKEGILHGDHLQAKLADSFGNNGEMTLGLTGTGSVFHLEIDTLADAAHLRQVLVRLVNHEKFREELERITNVQGEARGRLIIGDQLDALQVSSIISEAHIRADYGRIALPVELVGGQYELTRNSFIASNFDAKIGNSSLNGISGEWGWHPEWRYKVASMQTRIDLKDLYRCLRQFESLEQAIPSISVTQGMVNLSTLVISSGSKQKKTFHFDIAGTISKALIRDKMTPTETHISLPKVEFSARSISSQHVEFDLAGNQIRWGNSQFDITGNAKMTEGDLHLDFDVDADKLTWHPIAVMNRHRTSSAPWGTIWGQKLLGGLRINSANFSYGNWNWQSVSAEVRIARTSTAIAIRKAELCGIPFPGEIRITPLGVSFNFAPLVGDKDLESDFACFLNQDGIVTGRYSLSGSLFNPVPVPTRIRSLKGNLDLKAHSGRIHRYGILAKVMALLNLTEIFRGHLPDILKDGFAYNTIKAYGEFDEGKFILKEGVIDGASMTIIYRGTVNLIDETLNLSILVAPFKTIDAIVRKIPMLNNALGGHLVSIPFAVTGKWSNYTVTPLTANGPKRAVPLIIEN